MGFYLRPVAIFIVWLLLFKKEKWVQKTRDNCARARRKWKADCLFYKSTYYTDPYMIKQISKLHILKSHITWIHIEDKTREREIIYMFIYLYIWRRWALDPVGETALRNNHIILVSRLGLSFCQHTQSVSTSFFFFFYCVLSILFKRVFHSLEDSVLHI